MKLAGVSVVILALVLVGYGVYSQGGVRSPSALDGAQAAVIVAGGGLWEECISPPGTGSGSGGAAPASCRALNSYNLGCRAHDKLVNVRQIPSTSCNSAKCAFSCPHDFIGMKLCVPEPFDYCTVVEEPVLVCGENGQQGDCTFASAWENIDGTTWILHCLPHDCVVDGNALNCGSHGSCY